MSVLILSRWRRRTLAVGSFCVGDSVTDETTTASGGSSWSPALKRSTRSVKHFERTWMTCIWNTFSLLNASTSLSVGSGLTMYLLARLLPDRFDVMLRLLIFTPASMFSPLLESRLPSSDDSATMCFLPPPPDDFPFCDLLSSSLFPPFLTPRFLVRRGPNPLCVAPPSDEVGPSVSLEWSLLSRRWNFIFPSLHVDRWSAASSVSLASELL